MQSLAPDCRGLLIQGVNPSCECICDFALMANESVGCTLEHLGVDAGGSGSVAANHLEVGGRANVFLLSAKANKERTSHPADV